jgi:hypothetical protein
MRQLQVNKSNDQFKEWVTNTVSPKMEKAFDIEAISSLPYTSAPVQDSKKLADIAAVYSKSPSPSFGFTGTTKLGLNLSKSLSLKHTRGGRHTISGVNCECIRISVVTVYLTLAQKHSSDGLR